MLQYPKSFNLLFTYFLENKILQRYIVIIIINFKRIFVPILFWRGTIKQLKINWEKRGYAVGYYF